MKDRSKRKIPSRFPFAAWLARGAASFAPTLPAICLSVLSVLACLAPLAASAQSALDATSATDDILNKPMIPFPDVGDHALGNLKQIQEATKAQQKNCALWNTQSSEAPKEISTLKAQKQQHKEYFKKQRMVISELSTKKYQARADAQYYRAHNMPEEQVQQLEKYADEIEKRFKEEYARLKKAQENYETINVREYYFVNLNDYFPECYDKYPETQDPEVAALYKQMMQTQGKSGLTAALGGSATPASDAPASNANADCSAKVKEEREKQLAALQQRVAQAQSAFDMSDAMIRNAEQAYGQGQQEYQKRKQSGQYSAEEMEKAYKMLVQDNYTIYQATIAKKAELKNEVTGLNAQYDTLKQSPLPGCPQTTTPKPATPPQPVAATPQPVATSPTTEPATDCSAKVKEEREKQLAALQQRVAQAQSAFDMSDAMIRNAEQAYGQGQQEYQKRKQSGQYSAEEMEKAYKMLVQDNQTIYQAAIAKKAELKNEVTGLNAQYDALKQSPLPGCPG